MGMESFGGGQKVDTKKSEAEVKGSKESEVVRRTEVEISGGMFRERFSDGTYSTSPVKGPQGDGRERIGMEIDNSNPNNKIVRERFADGSYRASEIESIKV